MLLGTSVSQLGSIAAQLGSVFSSESVAAGADVTVEVRADTGFIRVRPDVGTVQVRPDSGTVET